MAEFEILNFKHDVQPASIILLVGTRPALLGTFMVNNTLSPGSSIYKFLANLHTVADKMLGLLTPCKGNYA